MSELPQQLPTITTDSTVEEWKEFWAAASKIRVDQFQSAVTALKTKSNGEFLFFIMAYLRDDVGVNIDSILSLRNARKGLSLFQKSVPLSVSAVLQANSEDDDGIDYKKGRIIQNIMVHMGDDVKKRAYFIARQGVSFRHQGDRQKKPSVVYLRNLKEYEEKPVLYYSSSGSGKTVELAGSSVSRDADLTIILQGVNDDKDAEKYTEEAEEQLEREKESRQHEKSNEAMYTGRNGAKETNTSDQDLISRFTKRNSAMNSLLVNSEVLVELIKGAKDQFDSLLRAAEREERPLRIVLAIDEGSTCPRTLGGLLREPKLAERILHDALLRSEINDFKAEQVTVLLSIAGTGVSSSTVGSIGDTYQVLQPYCELGGLDNVYKAAFESNTKKLLVPWSAKPQAINSIEIVKKHLPVVAALMENGRMASIAIAEIRKYQEGTAGEPIYESKLVDNIVATFMKANGLAPLLEGKNSPSRQAVAASALAVHLFRDYTQFELKIPEDFDELASFAINMDFFFR